MVKFLFRVGGGTVANRMNANGDTPLAVAAWEGHLHVVSFLTAVGVELQVKNADGLTAYDVAVMRQHPLIVKFFKDQVHREECGCSNRKCLKVKFVQPTQNQTRQEYFQMFYV